MEDVEDDPQLQKTKRALERKRATDRNSRRLERTRTKEHIAKLNEHIQLLLQRDDNSDLVQKLLADNAQLNARVDAYRKIINSATTILRDIPEASSTPQGAPDDDTSTGEKAKTISCPSINALLAPLLFPNNNTQDSGSHAYHNPLQGDLNAHINTAGDDDIGNLPTLFPVHNSGMPTFLWNAGPRTLYMIQHPSPLDKTSVYRLCAGIPSFHSGNNDLRNDASLGHTLEDVSTDEKLESFFGNLLPILNPALHGLYTGVRDHLSQLSPTAILAKLIPGCNPSNHRFSVPGLQSTNIIDLLKMSIAMYASSTICEAQESLRPEQRRSPAEIVAVFWIVCKLLTWMSFPTIDNYSQIPPWYRPTQAQLSISHPSYIDALVFPFLRDKLVYTHGTYETTKLLEDLNSLFTIVWQPRMWVISQGMRFSSNTGHLLHFPVSQQ